MSYLDMYDQVRVRVTDDGNYLLANTIYSEAGEDICKTEQIPVIGGGLPVTPFDTEYFNEQYEQEI